MKKFNIFFMSLALFAVLISGCKKKEDDTPTPDPGPTCTNLVTQIDQVYTPNGGSPSTAKNVYKYNANKKLTKIEYYYGGSSTVGKFDTIRYDANGNIDSVNTYNYGNAIATETHDYTYTSGKLTSVIEKGDNGAAFTRTRTFTYNGSGVLTDMDVVYSVGSNTGGGPDHINSIVFTLGSPTAADLGLSFGGAATIVIDHTAPNPFLGLNNDSQDILKMMAANNATSAYSNAAPGTPFFTNSYTYSNGRVSTITETNQSGDVTVSTLTYTCL